MANTGSTRRNFGCETKCFDNPSGYKGASMVLEGLIVRVIQLMVYFQISMAEIEEGLVKISLNASYVLGLDIRFSIAIKEKTSRFMDQLLQIHNR